MAVDTFLLLRVMDGIIPLSQQEWVILWVKSDVDKAFAGSCSMGMNNAVVRALIVQLQALRDI